MPSMLGICDPSSLDIACAYCPSWVVGAEVESYAREVVGYPSPSGSVFEDYECVVEICCPTEKYRLVLLNKER